MCDAKQRREVQGSGAVNGESPENYLPQQIDLAWVELFLPARLASRLSVLQQRHEVRLLELLLLQQLGRTQHAAKLVFGCSSPRARQ